MSTTVQERFPTFGAMVVTSAPVPETMVAIGNAVSAAGLVAARAPQEYWFRLRTDGWLTPMIHVRVAASVAGTNVYVRVAYEGIWRVLNRTLLLVGLAGAGCSIYFGQALPATMIAIGTLCGSVLLMWVIGDRAVSLVGEALPE